MKYLVYNCFFILIILLFAYINSFKKVQEKEKEAFTPGINGFFRPHIRNARIFSNGLYEKHKTNISNIFRKSGLM